MQNELFAHNNYLICFLIELILCLGTITNNNIQQTMSIEANFGKNLNKRFEAQETLPISIRIQSFNGTYADYLIHVS
jgi:hypothetical protein